MAEIDCLTIFISVIGAPDLSNMSLIYCFCLMLTPLSGENSKADAPPDIKKITRSFFDALSANLIITGISGVALAEAAGIGKILIPSMVKDGYSKVFAGCLTATASTLGPLIPPSVPLILYAVIAQASSGKMLLGGFAPGILTALVLMI